METLVTGAKALGFALTPAQAQLFQVYADELVAWNQRVSLTTITEPREIAVKHFLDSLTCLWALPAGFQLLHRAGRRQRRRFPRPAAQDLRPEPAGDLAGIGGEEDGFPGARGRPAGPERGDRGH